MTMVHDNSLVSHGINLREKYCSKILVNKYLKTNNNIIIIIIIIIITIILKELHKSLYILKN